MRITKLEVAHCSILEHELIHLYMQHVYTCTDHGERAGTIRSASTGVTLPWKRVPPNSCNQS